MQFTDLQLHERLHRALQTAKYDTPTPIQAAALPVVLAGHDIVGTAQTGTGKTAAFVLPILQHLLLNPRNGRQIRALILVPTRELAEQVHANISQLGMHTNIRSATVYGGVGMAAQERALRNGTEIIVACPGRLLDHVTRGHVHFDGIEWLVLDEADRMLDMGFMPDIKRIIGLLPTDRQTLLFSATFDPALNSFVENALRNPQRIEVGMTAPAETVAHALYPVPSHLKTGLLLEVLRGIETKSVLIFTRTKHRANKVTEQLERAGYRAGVLHSNKSQNQRQKTMDDFRRGTTPIMVATDIAARGIDVSTISHVINYDIPDCADSYIHRIGRTGRAERSGEAFTFVTLDDAAILRDIERILGARIESRMVESFNYGQPAPKRDEFHRPPQPPRVPRAAGTRPPAGGKPTGVAPKRAGAPAHARPATADGQRAAAPAKRFRGNAPATEGPRPAPRGNAHAGGPGKPRHAAGGTAAAAAPAYARAARPERRAGGGSQAAAPAHSRSARPERREGAPRGKRRG